jgi:hypothetical protein
MCGEGVADQEDDPVGVLGAAPVQARHGLVQGLVDGLRPIAAAIGLEALQRRVERVDVVRERVHLRHVRVTAVAVADHRHADLRVAAGIRHLVGDREDLALRAVDQPAHGAGRVEHEGHLDAPLRGLGHEDHRIARRRCAHVRSRVAAPREHVGGNALRVRDPGRASCEQQECADARGRRADGLCEDRAKECGVHGQLL